MEKLDVHHLQSVDIRKMQELFKDATSIQVVISHPSDIGFIRFDAPYLKQIFSLMEFKKD